MKRICFRVSAAFALAACLAVAVSAAAQTSLGDVARKTRKAPAPKRAQKRVITNDDLAPSRVAAAEQSRPADGANAEDAPSTSDADKQKTTKAALAVPDRAELLGTWKTRVQAKKHEIELLERECTVAEREAQLQVRDYYADAGERLRNPRAFAEKQEKTRAEFESKRADLQSAKQQLADMLEQARKDGIPSSQLE